MYDLLPIPFRADAVKHIVKRIEQVQDILERPLVIENVSYYTPVAAEMTEVEFINAIVTESNCQLLLDVNNVYVNAFNHGYQAKEFNLIDDHFYEDKLYSKAKEFFGNDVNIIKDKEIYSFKKNKDIWNSNKKDKIALIYVVGGIVDGESSEGGLIFSGKSTGSKTIVELVRRARKNKNVKAIVLRVNSGGGSAQ